MPFLLYTYLGTEILAPFFASLLILNSILFLGKLVPFLDVIFNYGIDFADFTRLCAYLVPNLLLFSLPMASMISVIIAFTKLSNDNEIMALKAAGIGLYKMLPPVVLFALFTAALTSVSSVNLIPAGNIAMKRMLFQLAKEKIDKGLKEKQFSEGIENVVLYVDHIDRKDRTWQGVYVSDLRDQTAPITIVARTGSLEARIEDMFLILKLREGTMHRTVDDLTQTIQFSSYTLNLPMENPRSVNGSPAAFLGKSELTMQQLLDSADREGGDTAKALPFIIEFHKRLALPAGCFILSLLGLPLALQARPGQKPFGFPIGLGLFVFYYILTTAAKTLSENQSLPATIAMWLPNAFFTVLAFHFIRRAALEKSGGITRLASRTLRGVGRLLPGKGRSGR